MTNPINSKTFLEAYDLYADALFRHCYFRTFDRELARDLVQESFTRTWLYIAEERNRIENIRAFLYRTLHNLIVDEIRKKKSFSLDELSEKGFSPTDNSFEKMGSKILCGDIIRLAGSLDPKYREAVLMRYLDDLSPKEIAAILGITENAVSVHINRGLNMLKELAK
ncbi:RNA polymerase sigma factor [Candidatus Giovannonibacteria bacterium]|nr:RNA polymerase sigma factor [Candidatus Giovannonibacteria bacterium]